MAIDTTFAIFGQAFHKEMTSSINKIFGIGLSRTGTTSLTHALRMLGYKASHWEDHDIINKHLIQNQFKISLLEHYDALLDNPIPSIYQELDKVYPGSKFILSIRDFDSWLKSVKHHFLINVGPQNPSFNTALCYGSWYFDEEKFTRTYYEHEQEVREYFKDRPEDLLIINICEGEGWEKLCPFLDREIPEEAFPHSNSLNYQKNTPPAIHPEQQWKNALPGPQTDLNRELALLQSQLQEFKKKYWMENHHHQRLQKELQDVYQSKSWRLIRLLLSPVRFFQKRVKD